MDRNIAREYHPVSKRLAAALAGPTTILVLLGAVHLTRLNALPLRGEETRWARVAVEMLDGGDWAVPRIQGLPFLSRPPLGSWLIAASARALGAMDPVAIRLPSAVATLLTALILHATARGAGLSRVASLAAGLGYGTMGHVLQLGRLAESEAVFASLLSAAPLAWYAAYRRGTAPWAALVPAAVLAALATLCKGSQAPVYVFGAIVADLARRGELRRLAHPGTFAGPAAYGLIVGGWQWACARRIGWGASAEVWTGDILLRFRDATLGSWMAHLFTYPFLIGLSTAPWSFWLVTYLRREGRGLPPEARRLAEFCGVCLLVAFPTCWLVPNARARYFLPLSPPIALLAAIAVDRAWRSTAAGRPGPWCRFAGTSALLALSVSVAVVLMGRVLGPAELRQPWGLCLAIVGASAVTARALARSIRSPGVANRYASVLGIAATLGLISTGVGVNINRGASEDLAGAVDRLREALPAGARLTSLGAVHHAFAYHYQRTIEPIDPGAVDDALASPFFCFDRALQADPPPLPFAWEPVAELSCERYRRDPARFTVVIGRRIEVTASRSAKDRDEQVSRTVAR